MTQHWRTRAKTALPLTLVAAAALAGTSAAQAVVGADEGANAAYRFAARVQVGELPGRSCSGALVAPQWVVTAKACFGTQAGVPTARTTVTVGRTDLAGTGGHTVPVTWLVPHPRRDVALARLAVPVRDVAPVKLATAAPQAGEALRVLGFGRTATAWVPDRLHGASVTVAAVGATTIDVTSGGSGAAVCKGDAGGPALRLTGGGAELAGLHHTSGQQGCHAVTGTDAGVVETRVDDLGAWFAGVAVTNCNAVGTAHGTSQVGGVLALADWNGDCRSDIMNQNPAGELRVFRSTGNLSADGRLFTGRADVGTGWTAAAYPRVLTGDFTGDGLGDIINQGTAGELRIFPGSGTLATSAMFPVRRAVGAGFTTTAYVGLITGDFNGDGRTDLGARLANRTQLRIFLSTGDTSADNRLFPVAPSATLDLLAADQDTTSTIGDLLPADVDGDGRTDIIGRNADGKLFAWRSTGVATAGRLFDGRVLVGSGWTTAYPRIITGDFNGDGRTDIANQNTAGDLRIWSSSGNLSRDGVLFPGATVATADLNLTVANYPRLLTGDVDGDGRTDIVAQPVNGALEAFRSTGEFGGDRLFLKPARIVGSGWTVESYPRVF